MAQGKFKVKNSLPSGMKKKNKKGSAVTRRNNAPVMTKKRPELDQKRKLQAAISKHVNAAAEKELRARATSTVQLTAAQKRVAEHHRAAEPTTS